MEMIEKSKDIAELLKTIANPNRLLILCALLEEPLTVGSVCGYTGGISQPAVSQHLAVLKSRGLIDSRKYGQNVEYFILDERVRDIINLLKDKYC